MAKIIKSDNDNNLIAQLRSLCFPEKPLDINEIINLMASPGMYSLVLYNENKPVSFIIYRVIMDEAEIITLGTIPGYRKIGLGKYLLSETLNRMKELGTKNIHLEVSEQNETAIKLYLSLGFTISGERKNYYCESGVFQHAILMSLFTDRIR